MSSIEQNPAWRRESPRDDSPDERSEIFLDDTPVPAWKTKPKAWLKRTNVITALIVIILSIFFLVAALHRPSPHVEKNPNTTTLKPQFFPEHKSQRVMIRYGPFTAPAMSEDNGMKEFSRMVAQKPCTDCLVTWMQAGLTYEDGSEANADTGMWLHHTVFSNTNRSAVVCPNYRGDRFFASGNERTPIDICVSGTDQAGYYIAPDENIGFITELMNMVDTPRDAYLTMTFEYIPGMPAGFSKVQSLWFDIGGCRTSSLPAKPDTHFDYTSPSWTSDISGRVTFVAGHLHDGGTRLEVVRNERLVCDAVAEYGHEMMKGEKMPRRHEHEHEHEHEREHEHEGMPGMNMSSTHISRMLTCENAGKVEKGDQWTVTAHYNTAMHEPMTNGDGSLEPIMGIALVYVAGEDLVYANGTGASELAGRLETDLARKWVG